jgi:hypothetical protein
VGLTQKRKKDFRQKPDTIPALWVREKSGVFVVTVKDVETEPVDPKIVPKLHHFKDGWKHIRVAPVQVRLLGQKRVQVIRTSNWTKSPSGTAEIGGPVVWNCVPPDVPVSF